MNRTEKNQQMQDLILQNAIVEFARSGYEAGSLNSICKAGGMSKGIIYHYFPSKKALVVSNSLPVFSSKPLYFREFATKKAFTSLFGIMSIAKPT